MVTTANYTFGDALLTMLGIFLLVAWLWVLFAIISDLFRDRELSGWWKAVWILFLIFVPVLTTLAYIIVRGPGMSDRALAERAEARQQFDRYIREAAGATPGTAGSPVDELATLGDLRDKGVISADEFERLKAKLIPA